MGTTYFNLAGVEVRDFYARAEFTNPYDAALHLFDIGFTFRRTGEGEELRLVIDSNGAWFFGIPGEPATSTGSTDALNLLAGERNELELVASGDDGHFAVNGDFVGTVDLSARPMKGDIAVGTGFYAEDQLGGEITPFANFEVWSLDEILPSGLEAAALLAEYMDEARLAPGVNTPFSDVIPLMAGSVSGSTVGVDVRDFYAHAEFTNPYSGSEHLWDIGFGFRDEGDTDLRIAVASDGQWYLSRGVSPIYQSGTGALLYTGPGDQNVVDLVAVDGIGYLAVNGQYVATLDLGASRASGDVWAGSGFYQEHKIDGTNTPFSAFQVWSLDEEPADGGGAIVSGGGELIFDLYNLNDSNLFGIVVLRSVGAQTEVEIAAFEATGNEFLGFYSLGCDAVAPTAAYVLNSIDPETLTSTTTVDSSLEELTGGAYWVVAHAEDGVTPIACAHIPAPATA